MYKRKKIIAFIPARAGSKRIKGKNKKNLNGIPLFEYSIKIAQSSKYIDDVIVSTDSKEILNKSINLGCKKINLRPKKLATDTSRIIDSIIYEIKNENLTGYDAVVLLQPTFPYRKVEMLDKAIEEYFKYETSLITVVKAKEQPLMMRKIIDGKLVKIIGESSDIRSQNFPNIYKIIGCIYINNISKLTENTILNENEIPFLIDNEYDIDIDTLDDFKRAERILEK